MCHRIMNSLINELKKYTHSNTIPFHMPGGKRNRELLNFPDPFMTDITEIEGFDNLHNAHGILKAEMERAARLYGADESLICVNGSTSALLSAVCGAFSKGDKVLVARNCHICIINALIIRELTPLFLYPEIDENGIYKALSLSDIKKAVIENPEVKGLIMTSPTYEGVISDIGSIADYLHAHDKLLIVDEAHGAHLYFSECFPEGAVTKGADLVVNSLHKTLPALTQTALLHINGSLVNKERVRSFWNINQTTSPSYVLMGSVSACFDLLDSQKGRELINEYISNLKRLSGELNTHENIQLFDSDDPGKIVLIAEDGRKLYDILLDKYDIQLEMSAKHYVVAMTSPADIVLYYDRFINACHEADKLFHKKRISKCDVESKVTSNNAEKRHEQKLTPYAAFEKRFTEGELIDLSRAEGCICLENVIVYPPGTPVLVAGEVIQKGDIRKICKAIEDGGDVIGVRQGKVMCIRA